MPPSKSYRESPRCPRGADYFTADTSNLKRLHVLFYVEPSTRRILWFGVTDTPN
jgi:hypothetical protein